jgi:hypothetical protein
MKNVEDIDLEKVADEISQYAEQWVAISTENRIVAHGRTYREAIEKVRNPSEVVLLKVPPLDASLAPGAS